MGLWFDNQGGVHLDYPRSIRCVLGRHEEGGCRSMFRPFLGGGGLRVCMCRGHEGIGRG